MVGVPETVLVAPDSFKGTFTATEVATAIGRGLQDGGRPADLCPVAPAASGSWLKRSVTRWPRPPPAPVS
jgi:glycerate kinase